MENLEISNRFILLWFSDRNPPVKSGFVHILSWSFLSKLVFRDGH